MKKKLVAVLMLVFLAAAVLAPVAYGHWASRSILNNNAYWTVHEMMQKGSGVTVQQGTGSQQPFYIGVREIATGIMKCASPAHQGYGYKPLNCPWMNAAPNGAGRCVVVIIGSGNEWKTFYCKENL